MAQDEMMVIAEELKVLADRARVVEARRSLSGKGSPGRPKRTVASGIALLVEQITEDQVKHTLAAEAAEERKREARKRANLREGE